LDLLALRRRPPRIPAHEVGAPAGQLRTSELPSVDGEAALPAEEQAGALGAAAALPLHPLGRSRPVAARFQRVDVQEVNAQQLAAVLEHVPVPLGLRRQLRHGAVAAGEDADGAQRRGAAVVLVQAQDVAEAQPHRGCHVNLLPVRLAGLQDGCDETADRGVAQDGAVAAEDAPRLRGARGDNARQRRQRGGVPGERLHEAGRAVVAENAGGEDTAAGGVGAVEPPAAEGRGVGQVCAAFPLPRRERPKEAHAGGEEAARRDEPRVQGHRRRRRRRRAPRPARGVEAQEARGVVQVARDLAEHLGGELGPWRRRGVVVHACGVDAGPTWRGVSFFLSCAPDIMDGCTTCTSLETGIVRILLEIK
jgi:hypothetical protein